MHNYNIPLQDTPNTSCCLVLTLGCLLTSFLLMDEEDQASKNGEWLTLHQNCLHDTHQQVQDKFRAEATQQKQQCHCHRNVKADNQLELRECSVVATLQGEQRSNTKWSIAVTMSMKLSLLMVKDTCKSF